jgi:DNA-binding NarL/FixJ family response regulator
MTTTAEAKLPEQAFQEPFRILIADDHAVVRRGIRDLLKDEPGVEVCYEASDGMEAVEYVKKLKPDLLMLDLTMPRLNGLDTLREIHRIAPKTRVLILTMHLSEDAARLAFQFGAQGYVLKSDADTDLLSAVRRARENKAYFTERLTRFMVDSFIQSEGAAEPKHKYPIPGLKLTEREVEIVRMLAGGMSNKQIAPAIGLSIRTVESHRNHIMHKMKFCSFSELIRFAIRQHLID